MDKTIILTAVITTFVIFSLYFGYGFIMQDRIIDIGNELIEIETISAEPTYEYVGPSTNSIERSEKMQQIYSSVKQEYPNQDDTTNKIIALCRAGNVGACSVVKA